MVIDNENAIYEDDYRIKMLKNNKIAGLLDFKTEYINNKAVNYYDVTGMKSLKQISDAGILGYEEITAIVKSLNSLINNLKGYLLPADSIILEFEYIFMDMETETIFFCYNPLHTLNIEESIRELFRDFLGIIDHSDRRTVELTYDIYCQSMKENFTLNHIIENIEGKRVYKECGDNRQNVNMLRETEEEISGDDNEGILKQVKRFIRKLIGEHEEENKDSVYDEISEEESYEKSDETMLIGDVDFNHDSGISLTNTSDGEVIFIPGCPCVLGKNVNKCDVIINESVISRIHMKFVEDNNGIYIEDMGSISIEDGNVYGRLGGYNPETKDITLNVEMLKSNNPAALRETLDTIIHEGRHAYQDYNVNECEVHSRHSEVVSWAETMEGGKWGYCGGSSSLLGQRLYEQQSIEIDARNFAADVLEKYEDKLFA